MSLADFNPQYVSQKWYNVLALQEEAASYPAPSSKSCVEHLNKEEAAYRSGAVKEESSDDSTIISSQTSTLTRNQEAVVPSGMSLNFEELYNSLKTTAEYDSADDSDEEDEEEDIEEEEEEDDALEFRPNLDVVQEDIDVSEEAEQEKSCYEDKQTNTECAFYPEQAKHLKKMAQMNGMEDRGAIKRSQTFSPSAHVSKHEYICKLNRSDSDSAMPLYRRGNKPFERHAVERRSLRFRRPSHSMAQLSISKSQSHIPQTPR